MDMSLGWCWLFFIHFVFAVQPVHPADVHEYQNDEYIDRPLLSKPESEFKTTEPDGIQRFCQQNAEAEGNDKPNDEENNEVLQVFSPVRLQVFHILFAYWRKYKRPLRTLNYFSVEMQIVNG